MTSIRKQMLLTKIGLFVCLSLAVYLVITSRLWGAAGFAIAALSDLNCLLT